MARIPNEYFESGRNRYLRKWAKPVPERELWDDNPHVEQPYGPHEPHTLRALRNLSKQFDALRQGANFTSSQTTGNIPVADSHRAVVTDYLEWSLNHDPARETADDEQREAFKFENLFPSEER